MKVTDLQGISINKEFMPSVANVIGTDLSVYRVVSRNQFAFNPMHVGRDEVLPINMLSNKDAVIVSPAYIVFEIKDTNILDPEYLMMWFRRPEFDREAWFTTDSSVRGGFSWEDFCDMELPIPSIEKQREIVTEYGVLINRINLNTALIEKLEDTAQALYRQWFVDFEFPDAEGNPYKSSGGEMIGSEMGEIPKGWKLNELSKIAGFYPGYSYSGEELLSSKYALVTIKNFSKEGGYKINGLKEIAPQKVVKNSYYVDVGDLLVAHTDLTKGVIIGMPIIIMNKSKYERLIFSMDTVKVTSLTDSIGKNLLYFILKDKKFKEYSSGFVNGSTVLHLSKDALNTYKLYLPGESEQVSILNKKIDSLLNQQRNLYKYEEFLEKMKMVLFLKMVNLKLIKFTENGKCEIGV